MFLRRINQCSLSLSPSYTKHKWNQFFQSGRVEVKIVSNVDFIFFNIKWNYFSWRPITSRCLKWLKWNRCHQIITSMLPKGFWSSNNCFCINLSTKFLFFWTEKYFKDVVEDNFAVSVIFRPLSWNGRPFPESCCFQKWRGCRISWMWNLDRRNI